MEDVILILAILGIYQSETLAAQFGTITGYVLLSNKQDD